MAPGPDPLFNVLSIPALRGYVNPYKKTMANATPIEWTDRTWNPVTGCAKVSTGCKHCYAERLWDRLARPNMPYHGRKFTDVKMHVDRIEQPLTWRKPSKVFVNSRSDLFHEQITDDFLDKIFAVMTLAKKHTFQILTKQTTLILLATNTTTTKKCSTTPNQHSTKSIIVTILSNMSFQSTSQNQT